MSIINSYNLYLNSKYRSSGDNTDASWSLPTPFTKEHEMNYFTCQVMAIDLPYSFKTINDTNNDVLVHITHDAIDADYTLTLTKGNYNINNLLIEFDVQLTALCNSIPAIATHTPDFVFTYDQDTGRCTLYMTRNGGNALSITIYWTGTKANDLFGEILGFSDYDTIMSYTNTGVWTGTNYISNQNVNVAISSVFLRSGNLNQEPKNYERQVEFKTSTSDILLKIPINSPFNSVIIYENSNVINRLTNKVIDSINLYLTSVSYDPIFLNNCHYFIHLQIQEIMPDYVKEHIQQEKDKNEQLQLLQNQKDDLLKQLEGITTDIKTEITKPTEITQQEQDAKATANVEQMKQDLIQEIKDNRENPN